MSPEVEKPDKKEKEYIENLGPKLKFMSMALMANKNLKPNIPSKNPLRKEDVPNTPQATSRQLFNIVFHETTKDIQKIKKED